MKLIVAADAREAARDAASVIAAASREAVAQRGRAVIALSGGTTPLPLMLALAGEALPWPQVHVVQVDERLVAADDPRRNLLQIRQALVAQGPLPAANLWPMPVDAVESATPAAERYEATLASLAGSPVQLDVAQLGLGADGHTASLVPQDPVLEVRDRDVAVTNAYAGVPRMTLTFPALSRARLRVWFVTGESKREALEALVLGHGSAPSIGVRREASVVVADAAALTPALSRWSLEREH